MVFWPTMRTCRIHVMGASGAGVTTLGRAVADTLSAPHHDTDDYYWVPTTPPYREKRARADRLSLMHAMFTPRPDWVLSGSLDDWGGELGLLFDLVVFVRTQVEVRLARLRARELRRYGEAAMAPGGWQHREAEAFIEWASHYEDGTREGRHLTRHLAWLERLSCPVLHVDGTRRVADLAAEVVTATMNARYATSPFSVRRSG
jgi:adenylate kinase family enzyme